MGQEWIANTGEKPYSNLYKLDVKYRSGKICENIFCGYVSWKILGNDDDVVEYRRTNRKKK